MIVVGLIDHAITLLFAVWMAPCERSRCTHAWDRGLESLAFGRARSAVSIFGFIHPVVRAGRSEPELCAIDPHAVQDDSDLASDGYDGTPTALGLHQPHAPGLQARPFDRAHEHGVGGGVPAFADLRALCSRVGLRRKDGSG